MDNSAFSLKHLYITVEIAIIVGEESIATLDFI